MIKKLPPYYLLKDRVLKLENYFKKIMINNNIDRKHYFLKISGTIKDLNGRKENLFEFNSIDDIDDIDEYRFKKIVSLKLSITSFENKDNFLFRISFFRNKITKLESYLDKRNFEEQFNTIKKIIEYNSSSHIKFIYSEKTGFFILSVIIMLLFFIISREINSIIILGQIGLFYSLIVLSSYLFFKKFIFYTQFGENDLDNFIQSNKYQLAIISIILLAILSFTDLDFFLMIRALLGDLKDCK